MAVGGGTYSPRHKGHFSGPPQWNRSHRLHVCRVPTSRKERTKAVGDFGFSGAAASSCGTVTTRRGVAWRRGINSIHSLYCAPCRVCVGLRTARLGQMMRPDAVPPPSRAPFGTWLAVKPPDPPHGSGCGGAANSFDDAGVSEHAAIPKVKYGQGETA